MTTELATVRHKAFDVNILAGLVRKSTADKYVGKLKAYVAFAGSAEAALDPATFAKWRAHMAAGNLSPNTINLHLASVRAMMKEAAAQGYISHETAEQFAAVRGVKPSAMKDKLKQNARTKIVSEDMRRLCDAPQADTLVGKMHRALLLTMASSGARISEIVTLKPTQIEARKKGKVESFVIIVSGKTDTGNREAPLSSEAFKAIQEWLTARSAVGVASEFIFTGFSGRGGRDPRSTHITTEAAWQTVKRYAEACQLAHIKPHDFRRFVGTTLAKDNPRQAQKALGHKDIATTYKHYVLDEMEVGLTENLF
jgi:integrase